MEPLAKTLRSKLENTVKDARDVAEAGARAALDQLGVAQATPDSHLSEAERSLRRRLRAHGRQLGDSLNGGKTQSMERLVQEVAYEHWHRMLFARFLAENNLLMYPDPVEPVAISLEECEEMAPDEGARNGWELAARYAARMLPQIFRQDSPVFEISLPPEHQRKLENLLAGLSGEVFSASDSLGWVYQFWRANEKDAVNLAGEKINADTLPAVTQLFTEHYMVEFLLHNTLGAWWWHQKERGRPARSPAQTEAQAREQIALPGITWNYLRFVERSASVPLADSNDGQDARAPFLHPCQEIDAHNRRLPHWQQADCWIFVTWRMADALPAEKLQEWSEDKETWLKFHPKPWSGETENEYHARFSGRIDDWLDSGEGSCLLRDPELRKIVADALGHFDADRYDLGDFVIMPNHVHVLFRPREGHRMEDILHSWKSFTAKAVNKHAGRSGSFWQEEYWDRLIRNERHLAACQRYIEENPQRAQLPAGQFTTRSASVPLANPNDGQDARAPLVPAAGGFPGWPQCVRELRVLDPCCGSGHFLVALLELLVAMLREEEKLGAEVAVRVVLGEMLHGLEIDARCTQLAAFNVAFAAWKIVGKPVDLPPLRIACSGLSVGATREEWLAAVPDKDSHFLIGQLYDLFKKAPELGSLINPARVSNIGQKSSDLLPSVRGLLGNDPTANPERHELGVTAAGLAQAAEILGGKFHLVATNVPYLARGKQNDSLREFCDGQYPDAKTDLATCFVERCLSFCRSGGSTALVTPQNWLFLITYKDLRGRLLEMDRWDFVARLGPRAFETISGEVVNVTLVALSRAEPGESQKMLGLDVAEQKTPSQKANALLVNPVVLVSQQKQLSNPDAKIVFADLTNAAPLGKLASSFQGLKTGDDGYFRRDFWELPSSAKTWLFFQGTVSGNTLYSGKESILRYERGGAEIARNQGIAAWGKIGVAVSQMSDLPSTIYLGEAFDSNVAPIIPRDCGILPALWAFCSSREFVRDVRRLDPKVAVANGTFANVPFDLAHWQQVAAEKYPNGLPKPHSDDPTQWLFNGHPKGAGASRPLAAGTRGEDAPAQRSASVPLADSNSGQDAHAPLQVAVARLLGYRWPRQTGSEFPDCPALGPDGLEGFADEDGIVCIPPVRGEAPAADRLLNLLAAAYGDEWTSSTLGQLLAQADHAGKTLETWLRDKFFLQHCKLFHHRPFVWHIWDGLRDGFSALVNSHKLTAKLLETLIYTYLNDWIARQDRDKANGVDGAQEKLAAAENLKKRLELIRQGEPPYDIFVRWKPLAQQPFGWDPDLNDGVRLNIRPFMTAEVLRFNKKPQLNITWDKDRGKDVPSAPWFPVFNGDRINNHHLTRADKETVRVKTKEKPHA